MLASDIPSMTAQPDSPLPHANEAPALPEPHWCAECLHWATPEYTCVPCLDCGEHQNWQFTTDEEFPVEAEDYCVYVGAGDDCYCHACQRFEAESKRRETEQYWRDRVAREGGEAVGEDDRKPERDKIARAIADSEALMWLMVGANHPDAHLNTLRGAYAAYTDVDGGYGRWRGRQRPLTDEERALLDERLRELGGHDRNRQ